MAQAVYSVNAVGYINLNMGPGNNLVVNQLNVGNNGLSAVIPGAPLLAQVLTFNRTTSNFESDSCDGAGAWFSDATGELSTTTIPPGKGFFFNNPNTADLVVTFVGEVPQGTTLTVPLHPGLNLVGSIVPQDLSLSAANGFPQRLLMQYLRFNRATQSYESLSNDGVDTWFSDTTGLPEDARPLVGQGFFINNPEGAIDWVRNFTIP
jgi:hypothetical protein